MSKTLVLFCCLFLMQQGFSQQLDFTALLDSGKSEFKRQSLSDNPNFSAANSLLRKAVKLQPSNAEARYFLAHVIDKLNVPDGSTIPAMQKKLVLETSEQIEALNKLSPTYDGELWILDPYFKLSSLWGTLALSYLTKGKTDSALYAFRSGKQRGGFINAELSFHRQLLNSCGKNAILISNGDYLSALLYLQYVEKLRTDVVIIDFNLLSAPWYVKYLHQQQQLKLSYSNTDIDTLTYKEWTPAEVSLRDPGNPNNTISWTLNATYDGRLLLKRDLMLLDILQQNLNNRPLHYSYAPDSSSNLSLNDYLHPDGLLFTLIRKDVTNSAYLDAAIRKLQSYTIDNLNEQEIRKSQDALVLLNEFRRAYLLQVGNLRTVKEFARGRKLMEEMEKKFNENKLPWSSDQMQQSLIQLRGLLTTEI